MNILYLMDLTGTAFFAASGAWAGVNRRMDLFGITVLGIVTATGGGTIRDILLGSNPPFCLKDETYLYLSIIVSVTVFILRKKFQALERPLLYFDAVGLGTFAVIGTGKALLHNLGPLGSVLMGVITATAGGMVRDILSGQVPLILRKEVYASACIAGGLIMVIFHVLNMDEGTASLISALAVTSVRICAIRYNWSLPKAG